MKTSPCLDCHNRETHCHISCEKYKAFRAEVDKLAEKRSAQNQNYLIMIGVETARHERTNRRRTPLNF